MAKVYRCPKCNNSDIVWDVGLKRYVCPKDKTLLIDFIPTDEELPMYVEKDGVRVYVAPRIRKISQKEKRLNQWRKKILRHS